VPQHFVIFKTLLRIRQQGNLTDDLDTLDLAFPVSQTADVVQVFRRANFSVEKDSSQWGCAVKRSTECRDVLFIDGAFHSMQRSVALWGYYISRDQSSVCFSTYSQVFARQTVLNVKDIHLLDDRSLALALPRQPDEVLLGLYGLLWRKATDVAVEDCSQADSAILLPNFVDVCGNSYDDRMNAPMMGKGVQNRTLATAARIFDSIGVDYFAVFGTLLGLYRDQHHEKIGDDVDLAFPMHRYGNVAAAFRKYGFTVEGGPHAWGCVGKSRNNCLEILYVYKKNREKLGGCARVSRGWPGNTLDLWGYYPSADGSNMCIRTYKAVIPHAAVFPLHKIVPARMPGCPPIQMPKNPEQQIEQFYSKDWRGPGGHAPDFTTHLDSNMAKFYVRKCGWGYTGPINAIPGH